MASARRRQVIGLGLAAAVVLAVPVPRVSAEGEVTLGGRVVDSDGAPLSDARVTIVSPALPDGDVTLATDGAGAFRLAALEAGLYDVLVERTGFRPAELRDVSVRPGTGDRVVIRMEPEAAGGVY